MMYEEAVCKLREAMNEARSKVRLFEEPGFQVWWDKLQTEKKQAYLGFTAYALRKLFTVGDTTTFESMPIRTLRDLAKQKGIKYYSTKPKAVLVAELKETCK